MPLGATLSDAVAINNVGQIVGYSDIGATLWSKGAVIDLGEGEASAINDAGQVVGSSDIGGISSATLWSGGTVTDLGVLRGGTSSVALAINDAGQVVGITVLSAGGAAATLWSDGTIINLNAVLTSDRNQGLLGSAQGINDLGKISAGLVVDGGFLLTPCPACIIPTPEPSTWAMMLVGFAGLAFAGYRQAKRVSPACV